MVHKNKRPHHSFSSERKDSSHFQRFADGGFARVNNYFGHSNLYYLLSTDRMSRLLFLFEPPLNHRGVTRHQGVVRHIAGDHASGGHNAAITNGYAGQEGHVAAQPAIFSNGDGVGILLLFPAFHGVHRVIGRVKLAVGTNACMLANADMPSAHANSVVVDKHILGKDKVAAVITMNGWTDGAGSGYAGDKLLDHLPVVLVEDGHRLQPGAQLHRMLETKLYLRIREVG